jgi:cysteine desulfurase
MTNTSIYLDYNSTTPADERVLAEMLPFFTTYFGNASSKTHKYGWEAEAAVESARERVAAFIGAETSEIIFTSGSTEAINIALHGLAAAYGNRKNKIITAPTEHKAVLDTLDALQAKGFNVIYLPVDRMGNIDLSALSDETGDDALCVCLMMANNETGVIHPFHEIGKICREKNIFFFTDATQAAGKIMIDVKESGIDMLCLSAHKFYGPKGVGALYIRRKNPSVKLIPWLTGGGHEKGLRPGTLNVPGIAGLGKACELSAALHWEESSRLSALRTAFEQTLESGADIHINGNIRSRLSNTTNIHFGGIEASRLIRELPLLAFSTGSACTSALPMPSHVLKAMGLSDEEVYASVRFSLGRFTSMEQIETASFSVLQAVKKLRS